MDVFIHHIYEYEKGIRKMKTDVCLKCTASSCPKNFNILIIGGIEKMKSNYEKAVKSIHGNFAYHNGHKSKENKKIDRLVKWADFVICPVDVNSHFACRYTKKICKKTKTQYKMLPNSGVSSICNCIHCFWSEAN